MTTYSELLAHSMLESHTYIYLLAEILVHPQKTEFILNLINIRGVDELA